VLFGYTSIGGELEGRDVVEIYADIVPKTAENFRALCIGEKRIGSHRGAPLHYKVTFLYFCICFGSTMTFLFVRTIYFWRILVFISVIF